MIKYSKLFFESRRKERKQLYRFLPFLIALLYLPACIFGIKPGFITIPTFLCYGLIFAFLLWNIRGFRISGFDGARPFFILLVFNILTYLRGLLNAEVKSDYVELLSMDLFSYFLVPIYIFFSDLFLFKRVCRLLITVGIVFCGFLYFFPPEDEPMSFGHNISYFTLLLICSRFLKDKKYLILFILISIIAVTYNLDRRSITLNFLVAFVIAICGNLFNNRIVRLSIFVGSIVLPMTLLFLGLTGRFNVFQFIENTHVGPNVTKERQYTVDSRTSIYIDVFQELLVQDKIVVGLGARGKTHTSLVNNANHDYWKIYSRGRSQTESGMLNFFQYGGFVGFLVYSFFLLSCAYFALFKSRNNFIRLIGVLVCYRYVYSFVEDPIMPNFYTFYLFLCLGLCLNRSFRMLSDRQICRYLNNVFPRIVIG